MVQQKSPQSSFLCQDKKVAFAKQWRAVTHNSLGEFVSQTGRL
jgi:hypothetical protein